MNTTTKFSFMHFRNKDFPSQGSTIAILPVSEKEVLVGVAACGPKDNFNRKIGRAISSGRIEAFLKGRQGLQDYVQRIPVTDMSKVKSEVAAELERQEEEAYMAFLEDASGNF